MNVLVLVVAFSLFGCASRAEQPTPRYAFPQQAGKQYMTLQVGASEFVVVEAGALWSCRAGTCTPLPITQPAPGNCPCHLPACRDVCEPWPPNGLPTTQPQVPAPSDGTTAPDQP